MSCKPSYRECRERWGPGGHTVTSGPGCPDGRPGCCTDICRPRADLMCPGFYNTHGWMLDMILHCIIGPKILKICGDSIVTPITFIINKCISEGIFPDSFKTASVIPLHKNGSKLDPNNYRPISILPTLSKIFERHISTQLLSFLTKHNVIESNQSGFRKSHSCCTALINLIDKWLKDVDDGKYVGAVFLDLKKAFDLVDHDVLDLHNFSTSALHLIKSYIYERSQLVKIGDVHSDVRKLKSGVPQGSILGPILVLIYINDMSSFNIHQSLTYMLIIPLFTNQDMM